ncbi:sentrin-specific protease 6-like isoform X2 [Lineus longissimus]|uniref:sentrin-specific protease 6-like isoform X2 n=1 Tax=Lineus longissimus TaxID=88925 RepID=UPI002B4D1008
MSFFDALAEIEVQEDLGWRSAGRYGHSECRREHPPQDDIVCLDPPLIIGTSRMNTSSNHQASCLSDQHRNPAGYNMKNTAQIPKASGSNNNTGQIHHQVEDGKMIYATPTQPVNNSPIRNFSLDKVRKLICVDKINSEVNQTRNVQSISSQNNSFPVQQNSPQISNRSVAVSSPSGGNQGVQFVQQVSGSNIDSTVPTRSISSPNIRNMLVKATIPQRMVLQDDNASLHDQLMAGKIMDSAGNQVMISSGSSSGTAQEDLEGFDDLMSMDDGSTVHIPEASEVLLVKAPGGGSSYIMKDGQRYAFVRETLENSTHSLVVPAGGSKKVVAGLLSPSIAKDNLSGGGAGEKRPKVNNGGPRHGSATGSNMNAVSSKSGVASTSKEDPAGSGKNLLNSRLWNYAEKTTGPLTRPPLHKDSTDGARTSKADEDGAVLIPTQDEDIQIKKQKLADDPLLTIVCNNCGNLTRSWKVCQFCKRVIPPKPTWHHRVTIKALSSRNSANSSDSNSNPSAEKSVMDKASFYGNKLKEQSKSYNNLKDSEASKPKRKVARSTRGGNARGGKRIQRKIFTETVTISSDEDEEPFADNSVNDSSMISETSAVPSTSHDASLSMPTVGDSPSPSPAPIAAGTTCKVLSRRERMEDQDGNRVMKQAQPEQIPCTDVSRLDLEARGIRLGSMKGVPYKPVLLSVEAVHIDCETSDETVSLVIHSHEILACHAHLAASMPALFLYVTPSCGRRIREKCKMKKDGPYFDPAGEDDSQKRIAIMFKTMASKTAKSIESVFKQIAANRSPPEDASNLFKQITFAAANDILVAVSQHNKNRKASVIKKAKPGTRPVQANDVSSSSSRSRSPAVPMETDQLEDGSPPELDEHRPVFTGPVEKLIVYPPPPATGAITVTNEDLFCLNEGEFLNDTIIDFYLKYVVHNELSEEERDKTHIFNSFFYKRLTQKQARLSSLADDVTLPPILKRHARVKTWTRHVDIFAKDFVIVPINEHAHWFLAIICFPGLKEPEFEKVIHPKTKVAIQKQKQTCILVMDSLAGPSRQNIIRTLRDYLQVEWDTKKKETDGARVFNKDSVRGSTVKVPQQNNYSDCGVFILHYAESFFKDPIDDYTFPLSLQRWFPVEDVTNKRDHIRDVVLTLKAQQDS